MLMELQMVSLNWMLAPNEMLNKNDDEKDK